MTASQVIQITELLQSTLEKLPPSFSKQLDRSVTIHFSRKKLDTITAAGCEPGKNLSLAYVKKSWFRTWASVKDLYVSESLFQLYTSAVPPEGGFCGHPDLTTFAQATLIHELSHLYDHSVDLSVSKPYKALNGWISKNRNRNESRLRSVDQYEYKNLFEHFAVNMEYFALDPEYACRRPALYSLLKTHFAFTPFPDEASCIPWVRHASGEMVFELNPERVYEVHYLLAGPGKGIGSRFGHSALRFIVCKEGRPLGPDCLKDESQHFVVSYRGNVQEMKISPLKGLFGKYRSEILFHTFSEVKNEYTRQELRPLYSLPLKLTREQITLLLNKSAEEYWEYYGRYYFLKTNCASEAYQLLRATDTDLYRRSPISPKGVKRALVSVGLVNEKELSFQDQKYYRFPSYMEILQKVWADVLELKFQQNPTTIDDFFYNYSNEDSQTLYAEAFELNHQDFAARAEALVADASKLGESDPERSKAISSAQRIFVQIPSAFYVLENQRYDFANSSLQKAKVELLLKVESDASPPKELREILLRFAALLKSNQKLVNLRFEKSEGYGVPMGDEAENHDEQMIPAELLAENRRLMAELETELNVYFKDRFLDLEEIKKQRRFLLAEITRLGLEFSRIHAPLYSPRN